MSIDVRQVVDGQKEAHHVEGQFDPTRRHQVVVSEANAHGQWKVANRTTAGTTVIAVPDGQQTILITDIIVSSDKVALSSFSLQYTDGVNTEIIAGFDSANAPVTVSISINGRLRGWVDARLELVTVSTVDATVMVGYMKVASNQSFTEWDRER